MSADPILRQLVSFKVTNVQVEQVPSAKKRDGWQAVATVEFARADSSDFSSLAIEYGRATHTWSLRPPHPAAPLTPLEGSRTALPAAPPPGDLEPHQLLGVSVTKPLSVQRDILLQVLQRSYNGLAQSLRLGQFLAWERVSGGKLEWAGKTLRQVERNFADTIARSTVLNETKFLVREVGVSEDDPYRLLVEVSHTLPSPDGPRHLERGTGTHEWLCFSQMLDRPSVLQKVVFTVSPASGYHPNELGAAYFFACLVAGMLACVIPALLFDQLGSRSQRRGFRYLFWGEDNLASTSKFQFFLWTMTVAMAFGALTVARAYVIAVGVITPPLEQSELLNLPLDIHPTLLTAMGLSGLAALLAKATAQVKGPNPSALALGATPDRTDLEGRTVAVVTDDNGKPDLTKFQYLVWTVIGIALFAARVVVLIVTAAAYDRTTGVLDAEKLAAMQLPGIDNNLLVLMGLGGSFYLGNKWIAPGTPVVMALVPKTVTATALNTPNAPVTVRLTVRNLGELDTPVVATIGKECISVTVQRLRATELEITLPQKAPDGGEWQARSLEIRVGVHGLYSPKGAAQLEITA